MLLNQRAGKRYVDGCMHPEQRAAVDFVKGAAANIHRQAIGADAGRRRPVATAARPPFHTTATTTMLQAYRLCCRTRCAGILPLSPFGAADRRAVELSGAPLSAGEEAALVERITHRVPAGVDDAAGVKASYLRRGRPRR